jgi:hypothetical protein
MDVLNSDSADYASSPVGYLAFGALAPPRGEVPPLSGTDLSKPVVLGVAEDALVACGIAAALHGEADPAVELQKNFAQLSAKTFQASP